MTYPLGDTTVLGLSVVGVTFKIQVTHAYPFCVTPEILFMMFFCKEFKWRRILRLTSHVTCLLIYKRLGYLKWKKFIKFWKLTSRRRRCSEPRWGRICRIWGYHRSSNGSASRWCNRCWPCVEIPWDQLWYLPQSVSLTLWHRARRWPVFHRPQQVLVVPPMRILPLHIRRTLIKKKKKKNYVYSIIRKLSCYN